MPIKNLCLLVLRIVIGICLFWCAYVILNVYTDAGLEQQSVRGIEAFAQTPCLLDDAGRMRKDIVVHSTTTPLPPSTAITIEADADNACADEYAQRLHQPSIGMTAVRVTPNNRTSAH